MIGVLTADEIEGLPRRQHVGRLAVLAEGEPYIVPITYADAGGCAYAHCLPGRKLAALRAHPRACFEVDARDGATWRSVVAAAAYEELTDPAQRRSALGLLHGIRPEAVPAAVPGAVFRLRLRAPSGRVVCPPPRPAGADAVARPLLGAALRAGDAPNFPPPPAA